MKSSDKHETQREPIAAPADTETSRTIIVRLSVATHRTLRIRVAEQDTSIQQWVQELIERELAANDKTTANGKPVRTSR